MKSIIQKMMGPLLSTTTCLIWLATPGSFMAQGQYRTVLVYENAVGPSGTPLAHVGDIVTTSLRVVNLDGGVRAFTMDGEDRIVGQFSEELEKQKAVVEIDPDMPRVKANLSVLQQILSNLLSNAIKFSERGGIGVRLFRDTGGGLALEVSDTGIGMDEKFVSRLFDPFTREQRKSGAEGAGLGLAVTKRYLELNGASISVQTRKGAGTTFLVHLSKS